MNSFFVNYRYTKLKKIELLKSNYNNKEKMDIYCMTLAVVWVNVFGAFEWLSIWTTVSLD
jgi:hypothetical protein